MAHEKLLELRRRMKKKKPRFVAQCAHKVKEVAPKWKRPRGMHSKIGQRGRRKRARVGYSSPALVKHLTIGGLLPVNILNVAMLASLDKTKHAVIVSGKVGMKKRKEIIKECKKLGLKMSNIPDADLHLKSIDEKLAKKKETRQQKEKAKAAKKKETEKKKKEKAKEELKETASTAEEKEMAEKKEQDKLLVTKG
ncbi:hypothetical protein KY340_02915 [Candidatus Woesearchaeota archaeon]|nr:hypothetical protein [Candidatus Woesearchaeota archaeon]